MINADQPLWDCELSAVQLSRLPRADARIRNDTSMARKVSLVVAAAADPDRHGLNGLPNDRTALRMWCDPARRLWPWADREVDHSAGRNSALVASFEAALGALKARREPRPASTEEKLAAAEKRIRNLERQVIEVLRQLNKRPPSPEDSRR